MVLVRLVQPVLLVLPMAAETCQFNLGGNGKVMVRIMHSANCGIGNTGTTDTTGNASSTGGLPVVPGGVAMVLVD